MIPWGPGDLPYPSDGLDLPKNQEGGGGMRPGMKEIVEKMGFEFLDPTAVRLRTSECT